MKQFKISVALTRSVVLITACLLVLSIPGAAVAKDKITIFHAGSLTVPFAKMEKEFEAAHPGIDVMRVPGGSVKIARMISELGKPADIMASADYTVIDRLLVPNFADWNIRFATNQLVLCYTDKSKYANEINADNWYEILNRKDVSWGHSDPNLDPCGYRSLMVLHLAEKYYNKPGLYDTLDAGRPKANIRPKSVELISLLNTGNMDYAWEYLSVAVQHGLKYVVLPDEINLGNYKHDAYYKQAKVKITGKKPGTWVTKTGKSCTYGVTMVKNCPNPEGAVMFMAYLLDPNGGLKILKDMGQPPFVPCRVNSQKVVQALPASLADMVEVKN